MSFNVVTGPGTVGPAVQFIALPPGTLTHAHFSITAQTTAPGDLYAQLYIAQDLPTVQTPYIGLDAGWVTAGNPLSWIGEASIESGMQLAVLMYGDLTGDFRISWTRATRTNIKEIGQYVRAILEQQSQG